MVFGIIINDNIREINDGMHILYFRHPELKRGRKKVYKNIIHLAPRLCLGSLENISTNCDPTEVVAMISSLSSKVTLIPTMVGHIIELNSVALTPFVNYKLNNSDQVRINDVTMAFRVNTEMVKNQFSFGLGNHSIPTEEQQRKNNSERKIFSSKEHVFVRLEKFCVSNNYSNVTSSKNNTSNINVENDVIFDIENINEDGDSDVLPKTTKIEKRNLPTSQDIHDMLLKTPKRPMMYNLPFSSDSSDSDGTHSPIMINKRRIPEKKNTSLSFKAENIISKGKNKPSIDLSNTAIIKPKIVLGKTRQQTKIMGRINIGERALNV